MAAGTYAITTSKTDLNGLWRKAQGKLRIAANFMFEEWDDLQEFSNFDVDWSTREITAPFDLSEGTGVASIDEGQYEARPSSPATVDATFTWVHLNKRFTVSKISKIIQQNNPGAMLVNQMKFQGRKALESIGQWIADSFYGFSTGVRAKVNITGILNNTTTVITVPLRDAYGVLGLGSPGGTMTSPYFVGTLFRLNEWVAFVRAAALVANSIGQITAIDNTVPQIVVTFAVAPTLADLDLIVFANSLENTTLVGTDYGRSITGLLDAVTSVTVEGISSVTTPKWAPGYTDTAAGQFTNIKLRRFKQGIQNVGGGKLTDIRWSQGVENSVFGQLQAGMRFTDSYNMQMDGDAKAKGVTIKESRHIPPGYAFGWDRKSILKMTLLPKPGAPAWDDGEKIPDRSAFVFPLDYPCQLVYVNRGNLAYASNKTELL